VLVVPGHAAVAQSNGSTSHGPAKAHAPSWISTVRAAYGGTSSLRPRIRPSRASTTTNLRPPWTNTR
jgi:hypothetical protein